MTKILFIVNNLIIGGVEKVCWEIVSHLDRNQFQCDFLVATSSDKVQYYEPKLKQLGCNIYKGGYIFNAADKRRFLEKERKILRHGKYNVVHSHVDFLNIWTLQIAKQEQVPVRISHVHTTLQSKNASIQQYIKIKIQRLLLAYYSTVRLACSRQAAQDYYGHANSNVLYNGFDIGVFIDADLNEKSRFNLITVGRIDAPKNPQFIIKVIESLVKIDRRYCLYWIGDGIMRSECEKNLKKLKLEQNVKMIGATVDIIPYMKKCSTALFPSKFEGLGIAIIEAQLAHCYTYFSDVVPHEADVGYCHTLSLTRSPEEWAKEIHNEIQKGLYREKSIDMEKAKRYDVMYMKNSMENIYRKAKYR